MVILQINMIEKIRYFYSVLKNLNSYTNAINDHFLDYSLRHHKIIGWYNGLPVYSAFLTPGLSKPLANTLARRLMSNMIQEPLPGIVHIGVTDICNAKCEHCSFYGNAMHKPKQKVISTEQMKKVIKGCQDFGVSVINFVGGEPLLNRDLPELISYINKDKSVASLYTNGWFLKEKARALKDAGTMVAIISLDSTEAVKHDKFRKLPGLFDKAIEGIKECQKVGLLTGISTTLVNEDLKNRNFEKMIEFAKEMKVNELIIFDTMPIGMYSHREDLLKNKIDFDKLFSIADKYNKLNNYPGIFCYAHFRSQIAFGCSAGKSYFYITPYGEMCPCDFNSQRIGSLLEEPLPILWRKLSHERKDVSGNYMNTCCDLQSPSSKKDERLIQIKVKD